ncbi:MAG: CotH kinase family protein, partial [Myxococcota bacterium]
GETRVFASGAVAPLLSGSIEIAELRLPNDEGYFGVMDRETLLGELRYSDSPLITAGRSLNLEPGVASGGLESACLTTIADAVPAGTNTGTPGAPEGGCPALMGSTPTAGDLVITEIMANPDIGPDSSEWFEVKNVTGTELQLTGLTVTSGDGAFSVVEPGVTLSPGATLLFQQVEVLNLPRDGTIEFTQDLSLDEVADSLTLRAGDEIIDEVSFEDDGVWPTKRGWSLSLDPFSIDAVENNNPRRWCYGWSSIDGWENRGTPGQENDECPFMASDAPMIESPDVYALDSVDPIEMRVTIDSSLLAEIESTPLGEEGPEHAATFTGPGLEDAGATMSLRGATSRAAIQKSFKLRLADNTFREQSVINLSKSPFDLTRIRNQLSFRLMRGVPNLSSVRTQFIHLFVNDVDYGLYTQLENLGGRYLRNHRLDERGTLFKANNFFFGAVSAQDRSDGVVSGLEIKNGSDWASLIEAIDAVNDGGVDIDDVVERHFNRENLIAWLATNYALDNVDTVNQNFYLYSPDSDPGRYYFIPWDYDGALDWYEQGVRRPRERFREGVTNWLGSPLFDRWVRKPQNLSDFVATANELVESHYARSVVDPIVDSLDSAAAPLVQSSPDSDVGNLPVGDRAVEVERLRDVSDRRIGDLSEWLERPFPVWTAVAYPGAGEVRFAWSQSFDFQGDEWTGEVVFSDGPCDVDNVGCFADEFIVATSTGHPGTSVTLTPSDIPDLDSGTYYFTVRIRDSKGNYQGSFDQFFPLSVQWP